MELIRGLHNLRSRHHGCVATIGNFDGVHLGHRAIIEQLREQADALGKPALVMVFEPQPREYFDPANAPARLMTLREKLEVMAALGVDRVLSVRFNADFCQLSAQAFCDQVLIAGLGVQHLVIGDDFRFGSDRAGDFASLKVAGEAGGFTVENTRTLTVGGLRVSSTRVRHSLEQGDFSVAAKLLGQPFYMSGRVVHGQKLGRTIGVPTANLLPKRVRTPVRGVFAVQVSSEGGPLLNGVANVGVRPTVAGEQVRLEVHLLDFNQDLYGRHLRVFFRARLRNEQKFDGLDALTAAIQQDIRAARLWFQQSAQHIQN